MGKFFKTAIKTPKVIHLPQNIHLANILAARKTQTIARLEKERLKNMTPLERMARDAVKVYTRGLET